MAKYKASPFYSVYTPNGKLTFDHNGEYETSNVEEVAVLNGLCPRYLVCVEEEKATKPKASEPKPEAKPAAKAPAKRTASGK